MLCPHNCNRPVVFVEEADAFVCPECHAWFSYSLIVPPKREPVEEDPRQKVSFGCSKIVTIIFDGGSRGNGSSTSDAYGSYQFDLEPLGPSQVVTNTFEQGHTNNEAEFEALIVGLEAILETIEGIGSVPGEYILTIKGDSKLVLNQIRKVLGLPGEQWKCKEPRLMVYRDRAVQLIRRFQSVELVWQPREDSVAVLGH